jgi:hypothetical protein
LLKKVFSAFKNRTPLFSLLALAALALGSLGPNTALASASEARMLHFRTELTPQTPGAAATSFEFSQASTHSIESYKEAIEWIKIEVQELYRQNPSFQPDIVVLIDDPGTSRLRAEELAIEQAKIDHMIDELTKIANDANGVLNIRGKIYRLNQERGTLEIDGESYLIPTASTEGKAKLEDMARASIEDQFEEEARRSGQKKDRINLGLTITRGKVQFASNLTAYTVAFAGVSLATAMDHFSGAGIFNSLANDGLTIDTLGQSFQALSHSFKELTGIPFWAVAPMPMMIGTLSAAMQYYNEWFQRFISREGNFTEYMMNKEGTTHALNQKLKDYSNTLFLRLQYDPGEKRAELSRASAEMGVGPLSKMIRALETTKKDPNGLERLLQKENPEKGRAALQNQDPDKATVSVTIIEGDRIKYLQPVQIARKAEFFFKWYIAEFIFLTAIKATTAITAFTADSVLGLSGVWDKLMNAVDDAGNIVEKTLFDHIGSDILLNSAYGMIAQGIWEVSIARWTNLLRDKAGFDFKKRDRIQTASNAFVMMGSFIAVTSLMLNMNDSPYGMVGLAGLVSAGILTTAAFELKQAFQGTTKSLKRKATERALFGDHSTLEGSLLDIDAPELTELTIENLVHFAPALWRITSEEGFEPQTRLEKLFTAIEAGNSDALALLSEAWSAFKKGNLTVQEEQNLLRYIYTLAPAVSVGTGRFVDAIHSQIEMASSSLHAIVRKEAIQTLRAETLNMAHTGIGMDISGSIQKKIKKLFLNESDTDVMEEITSLVREVMPEEFAKLQSKKKIRCEDLLTQ